MKISKQERFLQGGEGVIIIAPHFPPFSELSISHAHCPVKVRPISHGPERARAIKVSDCVRV